MKKVKVMVVLGTRPEIIRLSSVIKELERNTNLTLVHTGQNYDYELNQFILENLVIMKPKVFLNVSASSAIKSIGNIISKMESCIDKYKPEAFLILGDTIVVCLLAAKKKKIPIFHMEAGNDALIKEFQEGTNRKLLTIFQISIFLIVI